jgi:hypothetical protein
MPKHSTLSTISPCATGGSPPSSLRQPGRKLWVEVQTAYLIDDVGGLALLAQLCGTADLIADLEEALARDGVVISGGKPNSTVKDLLGARALFARLLEKIGIITENKPGPGHPTGYHGWAPSPDALRDLKERSRGRNKATSAAPCPADGLE